MTSEKKQRRETNSMLVKPLRYQCSALRPNVQIGVRRRSPTTIQQGAYDGYHIRSIAKFLILFAANEMHEMTTMDDEDPKSTVAGCNPKD